MKRVKSKSRRERERVVTRVGTRTFTLQPQSGRHVIFVHALFPFTPCALNTGWENERAREELEMGMERKGGGG